jgi:molybdate transport system substrate-binding protein
MVAVAWSALFWGCGRDGAVVEVFAASSLREAFVSLEAPFEASRPGVELVFNFAGSQELRAQLERGAEADVLAVADMRQLESLERAGLVRSTVIIAENDAVFVLSKKARRVVHVRDLPMLERIVVGAPEVPIGRYAMEILDNFRAKFGEGFVDALEARIVSRELNARQVLAKVKLGEADAGLVYRSDALSSGLEFIELPTDTNVVARYPMAIVSDTEDPELAEAWMDLVRSELGRLALETSGFRVRGLR